MNISTILDQIDMGGIALPEFQRGYVWNRDQVRGFMDSLYRRHPVGSLLVWEAQTDKVSSHARGNGKLSTGAVKLLLDGQQRITSLYGIIRGKSPKFFDGNTQTFTGLHFNLEQEVFEFYAPVKMNDNPLWIDVTKLMQQGLGGCYENLRTIPDFHVKSSSYINRLNAIEGIKNINLHIEEVAGEDKIDVVVSIFNKVNSGGTKLSKGDLALAKICAPWPEARNELKARLEKWKKAGFDFRLEWLLRCINAILTGKASFDALDEIDTPTFKEGLSKAEKAIDTLLNLISTRLGLDHNRVLGSPYAFPRMARYLAQRGGTLPDYKERDKLLYWYVHTLIWGRYAGSTESVLNQDLHAIESSDGALNRLIDQLRQNRGDLRIQAEDFQGSGMGARFYPLLYMLTRVCKAKDWDSGTELSSHLLGNQNCLQVHHIFPKSLLKPSYSKSEVNAIANFTFLTQHTNQQISNRNPSEYLDAFEKTQPGAIASHWIPMDRELWKLENYRDFLAARRELLAKAANSFLDSLLAGSIPEPQATPAILEREVVSIPGSSVSADEEQLLQECNNWVQAQGLPQGECMYELADAETGRAIAVLDLAWPNGLQEGYSQPVALLLDKGKEVEEAANLAGYRYFTDMAPFKQYVQREILAMMGESLPIAG